jgi:hypothetical protein
LWVAESSRHDEVSALERGGTAAPKRGGYLTAASARRFYPTSLAMSLFALFSMDKASVETNRRFGSARRNLEFNSSGTVIPLAESVHY